MELSVALDAASHSKHYTTGYGNALSMRPRTTTLLRSFQRQMYSTTYRLAFAGAALPPVVATLL